MYVCEDLATFDFDFNDVALGLAFLKYNQREYQLTGETYTVSSTTKVEKLSITAMAAGGVNESYVQFGGNHLAKFIDGLTADQLNDNDYIYSHSEIHCLMGDEPGLVWPRVPINVDANYVTNGQKITMNLAEGEFANWVWNVGPGSSQYPTHLSQLFKANDAFKVFCHIPSNEDGTEYVEIQSSNLKGPKDGKPDYSETGSCPQSMLLPWDFEWPRETRYIKDAYTGFAAWVEDHTQTSWIYDTQVPSLVTKRDFDSETFWNWE